MGIDAYAVIRVKAKAKAKLRKCLGADPLLYPMKGNAAAVSIGYRFFDGPKALREAMVHEYGEELFALHDDPRGLLVVPDTVHVEGPASYDEAVEAWSEVGVWLPLREGHVPKPPKPKKKRKPSPGEVALVDSLISSIGPIKLFGYAAELAGKAHFSAEEAQAGLRAALTPERMSTLFEQTAAMDEDIFETVCFLATAKAQVPKVDVNEVAQLADGTHLVRTTRGGPDALDFLEFSLFNHPGSEPWDCVDPRGIFAFREGLFDAVKKCRTFTAAVKRIGKKGRWLSPRKVAAAEAAATRARRKFLSGP